jgi:hypothetical protein
MNLESIKLDETNIDEYVLDIRDAALQSGI